MAFAQLYCEEVINNLITAFLEKRLIFWSLIRFAAFASSLSTIGSWFYKIIDLLPLNHLVSNSLSITQNISFVAWITYSIDKEALYLTLK